MAQVLPLKGFNSLRALNAFHALMLGVKMLPMYMSEEYEDFYNRIQFMTEEDQAKIIKNAILFVNLQKEEVEAILGFCADSNGVPYSAVNLKNLSADEIADCIFSVCMEIAKIKIDLVSEAEKKNSLISA